MNFTPLSGKPLYVAKIKEAPENFNVDEQELYPLSGDGQHYYYKLTKNNLNTEDALQFLAKEFKLSRRDIGYAGKKDKLAITTQWISLPQKIEDFEKEGSLKLVYQGKHSNKLRMGHLKGNHFEIKVSIEEEINWDLIHERKNFILENGFPNYFGEQRYGKNNHLLGKRIFDGEPFRGSKSKKLFFLSAFQSHVFNLWLEKRIKHGTLLKFIEGDLSLLDHQVVSGPIFGLKMNKPTGQALKIEENLREEFDITDQKLSDAKLDGNRRAGRVLLKELDLSPCEGGILFKFFLPKGSYATVLISEFLNLN